MNMFTSLAIGSLLLAGASGVFACDYPSRIDIPNGDSATRDEMIAGQKTVKAYVAAMEAYLDCIVTDEKAARAGMDDLSSEDEQLREEMLNKKYNAAVEEMETMAARFNAEVRTFKERKD